MKLLGADDEPIVEHRNRAEHAKEAQLDEEELARGVPVARKAHADRDYDEDDKRDDRNDD